MAASASTFSDAMSNVLADLSKAMVLPDANIQLVVGLQAAIVSALRKGVGPPPGQGGSPSPFGGGAPPGGAPNGPGIPGGLGGQMPPGGPMSGPPGGAGGGPANGQQPPDVDERR